MSEELTDAMSRLTEAMAELDSSLAKPGNKFRYTREWLLEKLDGAVWRTQHAGVAIIEPVSGGTVWTPQRDVDALITEGLLTEVTSEGVTRLVRP